MSSFTQTPKNALFCNAEEHRKAQNFTEVAPLCGGDSATVFSSPHLLTLEAADHEGVALPALGRAPQFPQPVGLRRAGEQDVLKLLLGCTVFCRNSVKMHRYTSTVTSPWLEEARHSPLSRVCRESLSSKSSEEDTVPVDGAFSNFLLEFP